MEFLLSLTEDQQCIANWNDTQKTYQDHLTLVDIFSQQAKKTPHALALTDGQRRITYQKLDRWSNQVAHWIHRNAPVRMDSDFFVVLFLERSIETVVAVLAALKAGAAYVPIDPQAPVQRLTYILSQTQSRIILTQQSKHEQLKDIGAYCLDMDGHEYQQESENPLLLDIFPQDLAYVIYTSGTTGQPKGVAIAHQGIVNRLEWMQNQYPLNESDMVLQKTPYTFDVSVWELLWAHQCGASIFICQPQGHQNPIYLYETIQKNPITVMHFVPSMLNEFCKHMKAYELKWPGQLKHVFCSGEALLPVHVKMFFECSEHAVALHNLYGPTEASVDVTSYTCKPGMNKVPIGRPIQNMQIHILNEYQKPTSIGEIGELYIYGVGLAREYLGQQDLTREKFIDVNGKRIYKTGDLACWTKEGVIEYFGRNDSQVKIRGYRIELGEIEQVLTLYPGITQAAVLVQSRQGEPCLVAYYESLEHISEALLIQHLKAYVPDYMLPAAFKQMTHFPTTSNGKLCRKSLPAVDFSKRKDVAQKPKTALERQLCQIWSEALNLSKVYVNDDFFFLGGHSLAAARIISGIQKNLYQSISLLDLYESRTIANVIKVLENIPIQKTDEVYIQKLSKKSKLPLTDFQLLLWLSEIFEPAAKHINIVTRKRLKGVLDANCLNQALMKVIEEQSVLNYKISKFFPWQREQDKSQKGIQFEIHHVESMVEDVLSTSMDELIAFKKWSSKGPRVVARAFYLPNEMMELQLCLPHLICDETSMRIFWNLLSKYYLDLLNGHEIKTTCEANYKDYILSEQIEHQFLYEEKFQFWEQYLKSATLFQFPQEAVIENMKKSADSYSSYFEIPQALMDHVKKYCAMHHLNFNEVAAAALSMVLANYSQQSSQNRPLINLIKSTRNQAKYDQVMGCMIRVEPIVVNIQAQQDFLELAKSIQSLIANTASKQTFSSILKFAFHSNCFPFKKLIHTSLIRMGMPVYTFMCKMLKIHYLNFKPLHFCWRLAAFDRKHIFLVNLNLWNNLLEDSEQCPTHTFGLLPLKLDMVPYELIEIDNLLDVCFIRDHSNHKPYLVLSANLTHAFKTELAQKMFKIFFDLSNVP